MPKTINDLNKLGVKTNLLSGDKKEKCNYISEKIPFTNIYSEKLPHEKLEVIKLSLENGDIAMIGDGTKTALSLATIGVSIGGASGVAIQSSDIVLLNKNSLQQLTKALKISKHTFLTIKQNLFWAFAYNIVAIPIAALGYLNPMWGALFMAFSDVIVIGNSIRLKYKNLNLHPFSVHIARDIAKRIASACPVIPPPKTFTLYTSKRSSEAIVCHQ